MDDLFSQIQNVSDPTPYKEVSFQSEFSNGGKIQVSVQKAENLSSDSPSLWYVYVRDVTLEETLQKKYRKELDEKEGYIDELKGAKLELEKYSTQLESLVEERTKELQKLNRLQTTLLDSLGQGFFHIWSRWNLSRYFFKSLPSNFGNKTKWSTFKKCIKVRI